MPVIKRNGITYGPNGEVILSKAEYDALPASKNTDNVDYFIYDYGQILTIDHVYPVGSIFMSINNVNPGTYLNGTTWEAWGSGRVPVGVDENDPYFITAEKSGGEKTHKLTTSEMPSHTHSSVIRCTGADNSNFSGHIANAVEANDTNTQKDTLVTGSAGGDGAHNNLQPYITCYMWKRTA